jgi:undecaprenyl diphosphate synthase
MDVAPSHNSMDPSLPQHVAIIMDGNGRWAAKRSLQRLKGHEQGAEAVREAVRGCGELGISYLTLFAFSSENWSRPVEEVNHLMGLIRYFFRKELASMNDAGVRINFIGDLNKLPEDIQDLAKEAKEKTKANSKLVLTIALSYGSHSEITHAVQRLAKKIQSGDISPDEINETLISQHLDTVELPDPDLLIRTSGEKRLSNFLLWQSAYAELVFLDVLWPDFKKCDLVQAVEEYGTRIRRFGAL